MASSSSSWFHIGSFSKPRPRRRQERHLTKGLMSRTMAVHVRFESWYISLPFHNVQWPRSMYFAEGEPQRLIFGIFFWNWTLSVHVKPGQVFTPVGVLNRFTELRHSKVKYKFVFYKVSSPPSPSSLLELPIMCHEVIWIIRFQRRLKKDHLSCTTFNLIQNYLMTWQAASFERQSSPRAISAKTSNFIWKEPNLMKMT